MSNSNIEQRLSAAFFERDVLEVAPALLGKTLVRKFSDTDVERFTISEVEAYRGEEDLACHASKGRTRRTEVMYWSGGYIYVYLIYGVHHMLNFVCAGENNPQAVLIRGVNGVYGPGRVAKLLKIDASINKQSLLHSDGIWLEPGLTDVEYDTGVRVGIDYAPDLWKNKPWRYILK